MQILTIIKNGASILKSFKMKTPNLDSELILAKTLNTTREVLLINFDKKITTEQFNLYRYYLSQRAKNKPIAYILGEKYFWKSNFFVNKEVLIPRPDTEIIIEECQKKFHKNSSIRILDIGTGSGCILLSLLKEFKLSSGIGIDVSNNAIKVAKINAKLQQLKNRVNFIKSNIDNYQSSNYDLIVSNPPYIKKLKINLSIKNLNKLERNSLSEDVKDFEPKVALDGGISGKQLIEKVVKKSTKLLKLRGCLILEIDDDQIYFTKKKLKQNGFCLFRIVKNLSGKFRCITSIKVN